MDAITQAGYQPGGNVYLALDVASSELWNEDAKHYEFKKSGEQDAQRRRDGARSTTTG